MLKDAVEFMNRGKAHMRNENLPKWKETNFSLDFKLGTLFSVVVFSLRRG